MELFRLSRSKQEKTAKEKQGFIYRFDSACGRYCYIGKTRNLGRRISEHRKSADSAIYKHCLACTDCRLSRQSDHRWKNCFAEIGRATGRKYIDELEMNYINLACEQYLFDQLKPFPLNVQPASGSNILLRAARYIRSERGSLEDKDESDKRVRVLQARLENAEKERDRAWERLGQELRAQGKAWGQPEVTLGRPPQRQENHTVEESRESHSLLTKIRSLFGSGAS